VVCAIVMLRRKRNLDFYCALQIFTAQRFGASATSITRS
jgi:hypothetical protein